MNLEQIDTSTTAGKAEVNEEGVIKQPMMVRLSAGETLVAEVDSAALFSAVLWRIILHKDQQLSAPLDVQVPPEVA